MTIKYTITYKLNNQNNVSVISTSKDAITNMLKDLELDDKVSDIKVSTEEIEDLSV